MTFGEKIVLLRKQLKWSQSDLAKHVGTSAPIIGRYERGEIKPSIEVAAKIAEALGVMVDYLIGNSDKMALDKKMLKRMEEIEKLPEENRKMVFTVIDSLIRDFKNKKAYAS